MEKEGKYKTERTIKERKTSSGCCLAFKKYKKNTRTRLKIYCRIDILEAFKKVLFLVQKYHHFWGFAKHEFLLKASLAKASTFYINRDF